MYVCMYVCMSFCPAPNYFCKKNDMDMRFSPKGHKFNPMSIVLRKTFFGQHFGHNWPESGQR